MDKKIKHEFIELINHWKDQWAIVHNGKKGTNEEIASQMNMSREHLQRMLGKNYSIDEKALKQTKNAFKVWELVASFPEVKQNVPRIPSSAENENQQSVERSLEMALSLATRLTTILEKKYNIGEKEIKEIGNEVKAGGVAPGGIGEPGTVTHVPTKTKK